MKPLLILRNETTNWDRNRIFMQYTTAIAAVDMVLVVNNNGTFSVLKNRWGRQCSALGFEVTHPMSRFEAVVANPEGEGAKL